jgi:Sulfotransferase domain
MVPTVKLVSLFSNWFSGATLFTILLDAHNQIVSNGESLPFNSSDDKSYDCSCGKYLDECEFYQTAARHMRTPHTAGWDREVFVQVPTFSTKPLVRFLLSSPRTESGLRNYVIETVPHYRRIRERFLEAQIQFFTNATKLTGTSLYMDGTKSIRRAQLFARDDRCEMKVIHIVRDGRAFCYSYLKHTDLTQNDIAKAAKQWLYYIRQVDKFTQTFPFIPLLEVRYEDLCRSTTTVMKTVTQFLEVPYEEFKITNMKDKHILGNRMRRTFKGEIVEDTSWKEKLSSKIQTEITAIIRHELERFGYL